MGRNIVMEHRYPADFWSVRVEPSSSRPERKPGLRLSGGQALSLMLLVSFGLWAVIWGAVALLAVGGGDDLGEMSAIC